MLGDMGSIISTRLLPLQLLGERATAAEHKVYRLNMALAAETGDSESALLRTYSLAMDMGVESKLFTAPGTSSASAALMNDQLVMLDNPGGRLDLVRPPEVRDDEVLHQVDRMCPRAIPLGDCDHVTLALR